MCLDVNLAIQLKYKKRVNVTDNKFRNHQRRQNLSGRKLDFVEASFTATAFCKRITDSVGNTYRAEEVTGLLEFDRSYIRYGRGLLSTWQVSDVQWNPATEK